MLGRGTCPIAVLVVGLVFCARAQGAAPTRIEKPGTIGVTVGGGYGLIEGSSRYGEEFDSGAGLNIGLRYVVGPHWSFGLSFESQSYGATAAATAAAGGTLDELQITDVRFDTYFYRNRTQDASQYLLLSVGVYRPEIRRTENDVSFPGENLVTALGLGAEIFIGESWGFELAGRGLAYFGDGFSPEERAAPGFEPFDADVSFALRGQVGVFFYLLR